MRYLVGLVLAFAFGFFAHAIFFPDVFYDGLAGLTHKTIRAEPTKPPENPDTHFFTYVSYDNGMFRPGKVTIKRSNYIAITNMNKADLMWLVSDNKLLNTTRGYGESERLTTILNELGTFTILEKNRPDAHLTVTVIP